MGALPSRPPRVLSHVLLRRTLTPIGRSGLVERGVPFGWSAGGSGKVRVTLDGPVWLTADPR